MRPRWLDWKCYRHKNAWDSSKKKASICEPTVQIGHRTTREIISRLFPEKSKSACTCCTVFKHCLPSLSHLILQELSWRQGRRSSSQCANAQTAPCRVRLAYPPSHTQWFSGSKSSDLSTVFPLLTCSDHSERTRGAEIVSARLPILHQVLCCADKVHLKRMEKTF